MCFDGAGVLRNDFSIQQIQYAPYNFAEYGTTTIKPFT